MKWDKRFFAHYEDSCNLSRSARFAGVTRQAVYARKKRDPDFAARLEETEQMALEKIEAALILAAQNGDTRAAQWMLSRRWPEKYARPPTRIAADSGPQEIKIVWANEKPS